MDSFCLPRHPPFGPQATWHLHGGFGKELADSKKLGHSRYLLFLGGNVHAFVLVLSVGGFGCELLHHDSEIPLACPAILHFLGKAAGERGARENASSCCARSASTEACAPRLP